MSYKKGWRSEDSPLSALIAPSLSAPSPADAPSPQFFLPEISIPLDAPFPRDFPPAAVAPAVALCLAGGGPGGLRALSHLAAAAPAPFLEPPVPAALAAAAPSLPHDALPHLLALLSRLLAFDPAPFLPLIPGLAAAMRAKWDFRDRAHLAFLRAVLYACDPGARALFLGAIPPLLAALGAFDRAVRLAALHCLAILAQGDGAAGAMLAHGVFPALERGFVFTDPELFAESFLLVNCLARVGWPAFLLAPEFFSRFPLLLGSLPSRGLKFVLNFLRIAIGLSPAVVIETGVLRALLDAQRHYRFDSRQRVALFFAEMVDWLWRCVGECDLFLGAFRAAAEACQNFPADALRRWLDAADRPLAECPALLDICESAGFWDTLLYLTEDGGDALAERAQLFLESHYWPYQEWDA
jgi:hypothetical protein